MTTKKLLGLVIGMFMVVGCGENMDEETEMVMTSFQMTGSAQTATVAKTTMDKIFGVLFPRAIALAPPALVDSNGTTVSLTEAWVVIKEIEFKTVEVADDNELDGDEVEFKGPYYVDLLSNSPVLLDTQFVVLKPIRRIKMQLHEVASLPADAPAGLAGNSIYLSGTVGGVPFTYSSKDSTEIEIGGTNPILPSSGQSMMVAIQVANLFKQIDLSSVSSSTDISDSYRVSGSNLCDAIDLSANDLYTCFRKGMEVEANLGKDEDGDGDLSEVEDSVK